MVLDKEGEALLAQLQAYADKMSFKLNPNQKEESLITNKVKYPILI